MFVKGLQGIKLKVYIYIYIFLTVCNTKDILLCLLICGIKNFVHQKLFLRYCFMDVSRHRDRYKQKKENYGIILRLDHPALVVVIIILWVCFLYWLIVFLFEEFGAS